MLFAMIGLIIGICAGLVFPGYIPKEYSIYVAIALLSAFDTVIGGGLARLEHRYNDKVFLSGFIINSLLAALLIYAGSLLDIELYYAAIVVFGVRLFQNFASIRRILLNSHQKK